MLGDPPMRVGMLALVVGCAYRPGSFTTPDHAFPGRRTTIGCLDLAIERRGDHTSGAVLAYSLGNRCNRPVTIDLYAASVVAKTTTGDAPMIPYDPNHEIRALPLDGLSIGEEAIEYRLAADAGAVLSICVDAASVVEGTTVDWQCFDGPARWRRD